MLAKEIALRNSDLTVEELNYSVQQIIDRIIFLRMAEDRGAEKYGQLQKLLDKQEIYQELCRIWKAADEKYNSGLFHFKEEKGQNSLPDTLTPQLKIKDGTFKQIIKNLYYPDSPYEFSVLSPEILGNVYEQFLGKVIRLTKGHQAKVEEKPEVKKAGGVFYTPQYIVEYIVENTIGQLCKDKTPQKVSELRILDPACGSGSFLLGAYNYLLNWHLIYYSNLKDKNRLKDQIYKGKNDEWHLTIKEKKRILLNNIYGLDIDHQAVEVTKLSLLLKVLEGENKDLLEAQQKLYKERALPNLDDNIKCGNTLIGPEIYDETNFVLTSEDIKRINTFDWETEFREVMKQGGFDAVIGNPPYIRIQAMKEWAPFEVEFYKRNYVSASKGNYDVYVVFVERGLVLLNENGKLGFILPHKFFNAKYGQSLRSLIAEGNNINKIVHFGHEQIFDNATTYTNLLFLTKSVNKSFKFIKIEDLDKWRSSGKCIEGEIDLKKVSSDEWNFIVGKEGELFEKLSEIPTKLGELARIFQGLVTGSDKTFIFEILGIEGQFIKVRDINGLEWVLEQEILKPFIKDVSISTFEYPIPQHCIIFPYDIEGKAELIPSEIMNKKYPNTWKYLKKFKDILRNRERGKWNHERWYAFGRTQNLTQMEEPKIIIQVISKTGKYGYDDSGIYFTGGGNGPYYGIRFLKEDSPYSLHYLQGILSSKVLDFYLHKISSPFRGGYWSYGKRFIEKLPIRNIDFDKQEDVVLHDKMVDLVKQMLQLHKDIDIARTPQNKELIQRQIDATDKHIDKLVYELYGLTEDEIKIIEDAM